jgi:hypothetical protein
MQAINDDRGSRGHGNLPSILVVAVSLSILASTWIGFLLLGKLTATNVTFLTPVLVGLLLIGLLLPLITRIKLPGGVEADLFSSIQQISSGPTGEDTFSPGAFKSFSGESGPRGKISRLNASRLD